MENAYYIVTKCFALPTCTSQSVSLCLNPVIKLYDRYIIKLLWFIEQPYLKVKPNIHVSQLFILREKQKFLPVKWNLYKVLCKSCKIKYFTFD